MVLFDGPWEGPLSSVAAVSGTAHRAGRGAAVSGEVSSTTFPEPNMGSVQLPYASS